MRLNQRLILFGLVAMLWSLSFPAAAQDSATVFRIGVLNGGTASNYSGLLEGSRRELSKLGWIEGKNIIIEYRFADQKQERLPELAVELVHLKFDVILAGGLPGVSAAKGATTTIPIVMTTVGDPVATGLVASLARPGGNITGLSSLVAELNTKRLEVLKDAVPKLARVGLLWSRAVGGLAEEWNCSSKSSAAVALKLRVQEIETTRQQ